MGARRRAQEQVVDVGMVPQQSAVHALRSPYVHIESAFIVHGVRGHRDAELPQVRLTRHRPRLLLGPVQRRHQQRH